MGDFRPGQRLHPNTGEFERQLLGEFWTFANETNLFIAQECPEWKALLKEQLEPDNEFNARDSTSPST